MDKEKKSQSSLVQTYAEDMAKVIGDNQEGLVKKIIHGEEQHEAEKKNLSPESRKNKVFMLVSILLLVFAISTLAFFFLREELSTVPVEKQFVPLIFNDQNSYLEISELKRDGIAQVVLNQVKSTKVKAGGIDGIYLTLDKQLVGLRSFLTLIKANFTPNENSLLVSDNFLMGVFNQGEVSLEASIDEPRPGFFILIKVRSAPDIFQDLRAWEGKMFSDLHKFFGRDISSATSYLLVKDFEDRIVDNKNARVLYDRDDKPVMMYVFADDNSVIITDSEEAVQEIGLRLASKKTTQ